MCRRRPTRARRVAAHSLARQIEVGCASARSEKNAWILDAPLFSVMRAEGRLVRLRRETRRPPRAIIAARGSFQHCGSGADASFATSVLRKIARNPLVVIDDGGHSAEEMIGRWFSVFVVVGSFF